MEVSICPKPHSTLGSESPGSRTVLWCVHDKLLPLATAVTTGLRLVELLTIQVSGVEGEEGPRDSAQTAKRCRCPQSLRGFLLPPQNFKLSLSGFLALRSSCAQLLSVSAMLSGFHFPLLQLLSHPFCSKGETRDSQDLEQLLGTWAPHS